MLIKEKIKKIVEQKLNPNNKKNIENLVFFLILLIITMVAINLIWKSDKKGEISENEYTVLAEDIKKSNISEDAEYNLEKKLENILSKISGVGKVQVLITYSETSQVVAMKNETKSTSKTEENDSNGGTRIIEEQDENKEIIVDSDNNPITEKIVLPKIEGAIIIAEGGENPNIKNDVIQAVSAVTGLATHKIQVFKMSN